MHILITRPASEADEFKARLIAAGHTVVTSPMLAIKFLPCPPIDPSKLQGLVITSRNALRALQRGGQIEYLKKTVVFAVGAQTAQLARSMGFNQVIEGKKGASELAQVIAGHAKKGAGTLLHLCGEKRAVDIASVLAAQGFEFEAAVVYRAIPVGSLEPAAAKALESGDLDAVILMSPRTARTYAQLVTDEHLRDRARCLHYACISQAAACALASLDLQKSQVHVPDRPATPNMLALVNRISPQSN